MTTKKIVSAWGWMQLNDGTELDCDDEINVYGPDSPPLVLSASELPDLLRGKTVVSIGENTWPDEANNLFVLEDGERVNLDTTSKVNAYFGLRTFFMTHDVRCPCCNGNMDESACDVWSVTSSPAAISRCPFCKTVVKLTHSDEEHIGRIYYYSAADPEEVEQIQTITAGNVTYERYFGPNGEVGFKATRSTDGRIEYLYLNPSAHDPDETPNVFVYHGRGGNPLLDSPLVHIDLFDDGEATT